MALENENFELILFSEFQKGEANASPVPRPLTITYIIQYTYSLLHFAEEKKWVWKSISNLDLKLFMHKEMHLPENSNILVLCGVENQIEIS